MTGNAKRFMLSTLILFTMFVCVCGSVYADTSHMISFQGVVYNTNGTVVAQGTYPMTFSMYDSPQGGTQLWTESKNVDIQRGVFSTNLGDNTVLDIVYDNPVYITYSLDGGAEFAPRILLTSVPMSVRAQIADSVSGSSVYSINSLAGDITIAAGSGISISTTSTAMTISALQGGVSPWLNLGTSLVTTNSIVVASSASAPAGLALDVHGNVSFHEAAAAPTIPQSGNNALFDMFSGSIYVGSQTTPKWIDSTLQKVTILPGTNNQTLSDRTSILGGSANTIGEDSEYSSIISGYGNSITDDGYNSVIAGGDYNEISEWNGFVGAGESNSVDGYMGTVVAGKDNEVNDRYSAIVGGESNVVDNNHAFIGAGDYNEVGGEFSAIVAGDSNRVIGDRAGILTGQNNTITSTGGNSIILAGHDNETVSFGTFIGAGHHNSIETSSKYAAIIGGTYNTIYDDYAAIVAGKENEANGYASFIGAGLDNHTLSAYTAISAGRNNATEGYASFIGAGQSHKIDEQGDCAAIVAGSHDTLSGDYSFIGTAYKSTISDDYSFIGAGYENTVSTKYSVIVSGYRNDVHTSDHGFIGSGVNNTVSGRFGTIVGGSNNDAVGYASFAHGLYSTAGNGSTVDTAAIAMGVRAQAFGDGSIALGYEALTAHDYSVALGLLSEANAYQSYAFGVRARANHVGSVVIGATNNTSLADSISSGGVSQIVMMAERGLYITNEFGAGVYNSSRLINTSSGAYLTNGGTWTNSSDEALKTNITPIDNAEVLEKIRALNITRWQYIADEDGAQHIGPMAQDFYAAFELGSDNKSISTIDPAGVALAGIQELAKENEELKAEVAELKALVQELLEQKK